MVRPLLFPAPWGTVVPAHTRWGRDTHSTPESHKVGWRKPNDVESDKDYVFQSCIRTPGALAAGDAGILFPEPERVTVTGEIQGPEASTIRKIWEGCWLKVAVCLIRLVFCHLSCSF